MSDQSSQYFYQNPNNKAKGTYLQGWTASDRWVFGLSVLTIATGWIAVEASRLHWGWAVLIMIVGVLLNVHIEYARLYAELYQLMVSAYIAVFLRDRLWENEPTGNRFLGFLRERRYRLSEDRRARIPLSLEFVEARTDAGMERYGVLNELDTDMGYMYVMAEGSAYGTLDPEDQQQVHADLSRAINSFFGTADRKVGVTQLRIERPADLTSIDKMIAESGNPFMVYANGLPEEIDPQQRQFDFDSDRKAWAEFLSMNFDQLRPTARRASATRNWQLLVISFQWKTVAQRALGGKLDSQQISDLPLIELGRTLHQELASIRGLELQNPRVMGPIELSEFIRCSLGVGVASSDSYYADKAKGAIVQDEDELEVITAEMVQQHPDAYTKSDIGTINSDLRTWPNKHIIVKSDRILIDDTWFMSVRFTMTPEVEHPSRAQLVHFAVPAGEWNSFAAVSVRTSGAIDTNMLMTKETAKRSLEEYRTRRKMIVNPKYRRRQQLADVNLQQVSLASTNQRYLPIAVLTAPADKPRLLDKRFKAYRVSMKNQGIRVAKIKGRFRMLDAVITGTLGVNRL